MRELTYEEFCELQYYCKINQKDAWSEARLYRNEEYGLQTETHIKKDWQGKVIRELVFYFVDDVRRLCHNDAEQYVAYMEKVCGVNSTE